MRALSHIRLFIICFAAVSVSLPMAWISLAKLPLFILGLVVLVTGLLRGASADKLHKLWSAHLILAAIAMFALSLLWTQASTPAALTAFVKHSKLIEVVLIVSLIRTRREALLALGVFLAGQAFLVLSSWIMVAGYRVPWATSDIRTQFKSVVFGTYINQTLIFAGSAAVFWHLRSYWPKLQWIFSAIAFLAVINVLFFQEGKTGYIAALTVLTLAAMWQIPFKWRFGVLVMAPLLLGLMVYAGSAKVQDKVDQIIHESQNYSQLGKKESSSGIRLYAWKRSVLAIAEKPLSGYGVGSWTLAATHLNQSDTDNFFLDNGVSNPHQEFLLWGVELGVVGLLLFLTWMASLLRDVWQFADPVKQASISVIAVMAVGCLFNCSLYDAAIGDFFCITLGLLLAVGLRTQSETHSFSTSTANA